MQQALIAIHSLLNIVMGLFWIGGLHSENPRQCVLLDEYVHLQLNQLQKPHKPQAVCNILRFAYTLCKANKAAEWREWPWVFVHKSIMGHSPKHFSVQESVSLMVQIPVSFFIRTLSNWQDSLKSYL